MQTRLHNLIAAFLAFVMVAQIALPIAAQAEVSMRCVGAPVTSKPCLRDVVAAADVNSGLMADKLMACCEPKAIVKANMPAGCAHMAMSPKTAGNSPIISERKCVVTVNLATVATAAVIQTNHRWMLGAAPAMGPPAYSHLKVRVSVLSISLRAGTNPFVPPLSSVTTYGLRAPPVA